MYSVRRRLLLALTLGFAVLILGAGTLAWRELRDQATAQFDVALTSKARALSVLSEQEDGKVEFEYRPGLMPAFERAEAPDYFQFRHPDGRSVLRSSQLVGDLPFTPTLASPSIRDLTLPTGRAGRLIELHYLTELSFEDEADENDPAEADERVPDESLRLILVVAQDREPLDALLRNMAWAGGGAGLLALLLGALLIWRVLARGLAPLDEIASQVRTLNADSLDARVELDSRPRELEPVVLQLNALLKRLHDSFDRERRFAGNVAHELRTPLAELRSLAAVGARWPDDRDAIVQFFDDVNAIAAGMESVIADLLLLARCHAGVERALCVPTELVDVVTPTWEPLRATAQTRDLRFVCDVPEGLIVDTDPGKFGILLANVLGNAVSYATPATEISCRGRIERGRFELTVANVAEPLGAENLDRLTEPFWRKDEARGRTGHTGLGLSLAAALATLLDIDLSFEQCHAGIFRVTVAGPAKRAEPYRAAPVTPQIRNPQLPIRHV